MLRLNLFGSPSIDAAGAPVTGRAAHGRRLALLTLLACARGRPLKRDRIIAVLWPDTAPERARRLLSDDVYVLRTALGDAVLRSAGDELSLDPAAVTSDVDAFERLLDDGSTEAAVELFAGPLLDGFGLSDGGDFERWLDGERVRLGRRYTGALQSLAQSSDACGEFRAAAAWWGKLAAHDPYDGSVALHLMQSLVAAGDRGGALRHARVYAALLREEFDAEPDPAITAFAERVRAEPSGNATDHVIATGAAAGEPAAVRQEYSPRAPNAAPSAGALSAGLPAATSRLRTLRYAAGFMLLLVVAAGALVVRAERNGTSTTANARAEAASVAVLPFVNMSSDPDHAYFSDGLTEQIIFALSRIDGLQVVARTSSFALRDTRLDVRTIGDTLGVAAVLEGSVRADGDRLRITAQLIDAATGYHIWTGEYDRNMQAVFAVQEEIAQAIAGALAPRLASGPTPTAPRTDMDIEAYDLYLRGLYLRNSLSGDALRQAAEYFDRAIARDPRFALAYAAKASTVAPMILFGHTPRDDGMAELRELIARALELDPTLGEAYAALGVLKLFFEWDWPAAEQALLRAVELNPNDSHAHHHLASYQRAVGRLDEAAATRARAVELDPLNVRTIIVLGVDYFVAGDDDRAIAAFERARKLDPAHVLTLGSGPWLPNGVANVYLRQGREEQGVEELIRVAALRGASASELDELRRAHTAGGMHGFWRRWLDMDLRQESGAADPFRLARLWALSGDSIRALTWLERAYAERNPGLVYLREDAVLMPLHGHPRMARILGEMRFPQDALAGPR